MEAASDQQFSEVKRWYQSTKKVLQGNDAQELKLPRTCLQCLASAVISELGDVAKLLRDRLTCTTENEVEVSRSAVMALMKSVATWLTTNLSGVTSVKDVTTDANVAVKAPDDSGKQHGSGKNCDDPVSTPSRWQGRILVVGAGATGACVALRLRNLLGSRANIIVWEKARGAGGRMSTNRQDSINIRADMGAQYLSLNTQKEDCAAVGDMLVRAGICVYASSDWLSHTPERPSGKGWRHLAGVEGGVNDALKKILDEAKADVRYEQRVASLDRNGRQWRAKPFSGPACDFDAVILAVPGCGIGGDNLNKIHGGWERMIGADQNRQLLGVQHDQRWTFALFLPSEVAGRCDSFFGPSVVEKIIDDGTIHMLCYQSRKTSHAGGRQPTTGLVIVAHTTLEWARRNSRANGRDQRLLDEIVQRVKSILGIHRARLLASKVITWKQCQVTKTVASLSDSPYMIISSEPPLLLAGDYFTESNFGGCLESAFAASDKLTRILTDGDNKRKNGDEDKTVRNTRARREW